jgi:hypothetical protein
VGFGAFTAEEGFGETCGCVVRTLAFSDGSTLVLDEDPVSFTGPGGSGSSHAPGTSGAPWPVRLFLDRRRRHRNIRRSDRQWNRRLPRRGAGRLGDAQRQHHDPLIISASRERTARAITCVVRDPELVRHSGSRRRGRG